MERTGWIGVDFDRTLATYEHKQYPALGEPIKPMVDRVKQWLVDGYEVRIMTARVSDVIQAGDLKDDAWQEDYSQRLLIQRWCALVFDRCMTITNSKDHHMTCLYDDRAVGVEPGTGRLLSPQFPLTDMSF